MTWFRVDDGLHKHRKRIRLGLSVEGFAALGLWTVAGSWSSDELTDGFIPDDVLDYLAPNVGRELAKRLEKAGLWNRVTRDGEEGWQFHQWDEHQPSAERVMAERAAAAERQRRARERAKAKKDERGQSIPQDGVSQDPSRVSHAVTNTVTHGDVTPAVTVPPTRPDPTHIPPTEVIPPVGDANEASTNEAGEEPADALIPAPKKRQRRRPTPPNPDGGITAKDVVAAFVDASREANLPDPTSVVVKRVGRDAKRLLEQEMVDPEDLLRAAKACGANGWQSLDMQLRRLAAERLQQERRSQQLMYQPKYEPREELITADRQIPRESAQLRKARVYDAMAAVLDARLGEGVTK